MNARNGLWLECRMHRTYWNEELKWTLITMKMNLDDCYIHGQVYEYAKLR